MFVAKTWLADGKCRIGGNETGETEFHELFRVLGMSGVSGEAMDARALLRFFSRIEGRRFDNRFRVDDETLEMAKWLPFAGRLVARGHYLPSLERNAEKEWVAKWSACPDANELRQMGNALAEEATGIFVDALVRSRTVTLLSETRARNAKFHSPHDAWIAALRSVDARIRWENGDELEELAGEVKRWGEPVTSRWAANASPKFALRPPVEDEMVWRLNVALPQSARSSRLTLIALGQAALLFPPLATAVPSSDGLACELVPDEARAFVEISSKSLEAAGYAVELPRGCREGGTGLIAMAAAFHSPEERGAGEVTCLWSVVLDGVETTAEELAEISVQKTSMLRFRGKWMQIDKGELRKALRLANAPSYAKISERDAIAVCMTRRTPQGLPVENIKADGWLERLIIATAGEKTFKELAQPNEFNGELRPYQTRGFSWLAFMCRHGLGACLADDMGLGKTLQALALMLAQKGTGTALLVAPTSVLGNWMREAKRFAPTLKFVVHHGQKRAKGAQFLSHIRHVDVLLTSYALLVRDRADFERAAWSGIVLDEAQNIKNPNTRQSRAVRSLRAGWRVAMTGTPVENSPGDLWAIMDFLNKGMLGTYGEFREKTLRPIRMENDEKAKKRLKNATSPFVLRRLKTDKNIIKDLPAKHETKAYCALTAAQRELYRSQIEEFNSKSKARNTSRGDALALLTSLKEICNHPANFLKENDAAPSESGKMQRLVEMLEEVFANGESALVFTQYATMGRLLAEELRKRFDASVPFLYGGLSANERDKMISAFQQEKHPEVFVLSLKAGGLGLTLTKANHVFHYDRWWNPAVEAQAEDRAYRIGQSRDVWVHKLICSGTLEEKIDRLLEEKSSLADELIANLPEDEFRRLVQLEAEG